jgi:predicted MFS family arabinose efflux permease
MTQPSPYRAPDTRVDDAPESVDRRFRWLAVVLGAAADLGSSTLTGIVLVVALSIGSKYGSVQETMTQLGRDWSFLMTSLLVGGACTVLGGYVAGRLARHSFLTHALAAGLMSLAIGLLIFPPDEGPYAGIVALLGYGSHLPLAALGGWLAARRAVP